MKKTFKVYILITLLFTSENVFSKNRSNSRSRFVSSSRVLITDKKLEQKLEKFKDVVAEELLDEWQRSSMSPIKKEDKDLYLLLNTPETIKYINNHKNEMFKILFLLTLVHKLNDKKVLVSNSDDMQKLLEFEKQVESNTKLLIEQFDKAEKNKKLEDFKNKGNYLGLIKEIKKMFVNLDLKESIKTSRFSFSKNVNSQFASLYRKYETIINEAYNQNKTKNKSDIFTEIRNDMILAIHYNGLFALESFLFWEIPFITASIDKKMDSKTKHQINLGKEVFNLISNFFGIKAKILKVTGLKAFSESIINFEKKHKDKIILGAIMAAGIGAGIKDHYLENKKDINDDPDILGFRNFIFEAAKINSKNKFDKINYNDFTERELLKMYKKNENIKAKEFLEKLARYRILNEKIQNNNKKMLDIESKQMDTYSEIGDNEDVNYPEEFYLDKNLKKLYIK